MTQLDYILGSPRLLTRIKRSHIERAGLPYSALTAGGEVLPRKVTLGAGSNGHARRRSAARLIEFPRERYEPTFDEAGNHVSDHCPVKVWF